MKYECLEKIQDLSQKMVETSHEIIIAWTKLLVSGDLNKMEKEDAERIAELIDRAHDAAFNLDFALIAEIK